MNNSHFCNHPDDVANWSDVPSSSREDTVFDLSQNNHLNNVEDYFATAATTFCSVPSTSRAEFPEKVLALDDSRSGGCNLHPDSTANKNPIVMQIDALKEKFRLIKQPRSQLVLEAECENPGKTAVVLLNELVSTMIIKAETNKQLKQIGNKTHEDEYMNAEVFSEPKRKPSKIPLLLTRLKKTPKVRFESGGTSGYSTHSSTVKLREMDSTTKFIKETLGQTILKTFRKQINLFETESNRLEHGSCDNVQFAFKIAQTHRESEQIEEDFCGFLNDVAKTSEAGMYNILSIYEDCLEYLCVAFDKHWPNRSLKSKLYTNILGLFYQFSHSERTAAILRNDKYTDLLMRTFGVPDFSRIDVLCGITLAKLFLFDNGIPWNLTKSRADVEAVMLNVMLQKWRTQIATKLPLSYRGENLVETLQKVKKPSPLIRYLESWLIANAAQNNSK